MIEITHSARSHDFDLVQNGEVVRGPNGAGQRIDRLGAHFRMTFQFPPLRGNDKETPERSARILKSRLIAAASEPLKIRIPLCMDQGLPGTPVVDGAGQSGHSIAVRGLTAHYRGRVGWWLNIIAADGTICVHDVAEPFTADADGKAEIAINPALRLPFADGDALELARPVIAGFVDPASWSVSTDFLSEFEVTVEEEV